MATNIKVKRAYESYSETDGYRIYIDRLWPRGLSHETFKYDLWDKSIAPNTELREWFHADAESRWDEFARRYKAELAANPAYGELVKTVAGKPTVTLLYSSRDEAHNNAVVVADMLRED